MSMPNGVVVVEKLTASRLELNTINHRIEIIIIVLCVLIILDTATIIWIVLCTSEIILQ